MVARICLPLVSLWTALGSGWRPSPHALSLRIDRSRPGALQQRNDIYGLENDDKMQTYILRARRELSRCRVQRSRCCEMQKNDIQMQVGTAADDLTAPFLPPFRAPTCHGCFPPAPPPLLDSPRRPIRSPMDLTSVVCVQCRPKGRRDSLSTSVERSIAVWRQPRRFLQAPLPRTPGPAFCARCITKLPRASSRKWASVFIVGQLRAFDAQDGLMIAPFWCRVCGRRSIRFVKGATRTSTSPVVWWRPRPKPRIQRSRGPTATRRRHVRTEGTASRTKATPSRRPALG